jgi:hypothetical protein
MSSQELAPAPPTHEPETLTANLARLWDAPVDLVERVWAKWKDYPTSDFYRHFLARAEVFRELGRAK